MGDLISRKALLEEFKRIEKVDTESDLWHITGIMNLIKSAPTVKARNTGYWRESGGNFFCSECNNGYKDQPTLMGKPMFEYCPLCGAYMRKKVQDV